MEGWFTWGTWRGAIWVGGSEDLAVGVTAFFVGFWNV